MNNILIVAAHSDDEALGCGGTIARHVAEGDIVNIVYMADGISSRADSHATEFNARQKASAEAQKILGISQSHSLNLPDNKMDSQPLLNIVQLLEPIITAFQPDIIYTHHYGDLNIDHQITQQAVLTACRPQPEFSVKEIYAFEVMSSTEWSNQNTQAFLPNYFIDISGYIDKKTQAIQAYRKEMRPAPHSRSMEHIHALAIHRGHSVGFDAAEAFMLIRHLK